MSLIDKAIDWLEDFDTRLEQKLAEHGDTIPDELLEFANFVDENLDRFIEILQDFAERRPVRNLIHKLKERIAAIKARRQAQ